VHSEPRTVASSGIKDSDDSGTKTTGTKDSGIKDTASEAAGRSYSQPFAGAQPETTAQSGEKPAAQSQEPQRRQHTGSDVDTNVTSTVSPISSGYTTPTANAGTDSEQGLSPRNVPESRDDDADVPKQHEPRISKS
jgi:hypothetical protein